MRTAIILHGICDEHEYFEMDFPSPSNAHWLPWLQQKFLRSGILCQTPEMPKPYAPVYRDWAAAFGQIKISPEDIVVGHSAGGGFILKWLHEHPNSKLHKLVLVAPWLDPQRIKGDFLECELKSDLENRVDQIHVLYSSDENTEGVQETKDLILRTYPKAKLHGFNGMGHFCLSDMGSDQFEALWVIGREGIAAE